MAVYGTAIYGTDVYGSGAEPEPTEPDPYPVPLSYRERSTIIFTERNPR
jgi:hypothetical protein